MNYKLGTSLNLLLTAINAVGFGFAGSVVTFALHKNTLNLNRPVFSKEFTSHTSNSETLLVFGSNEITIPKDTYWASIKIVNGTANTTIKTFKFKVGLFTDDLLNEDYNISIGSNNSAINFEIQGAIINQTGLAAPPRVYNENLIGVIDGSNATFTTTDNFIQGSEEVKINGLTQRPTRDYTITPPNTIQFTSSPEPNDQLFISYNKLI
jgi:hypothetical protein